MINICRGERLRTAAFWPINASTEQNNDNSVQLLKTTRVHLNLVVEKQRHSAEECVESVYLVRDDEAKTLQTSVLHTERTYRKTTQTAKISAVLLNTPYLKPVRYQTLNEM